MAGLYIHIPLCVSRCYYCDFYSLTRLEWKDALIKGICKEINLRKGYLGSETIRTVYFGGGTPSLLSPGDIEKIMNESFKVFRICPEEITLEANPDDVNVKYIRSLRSLGINRLSMGVQSFDDAELKILNRRHTSSQAVKAVKACQDSGIDNLSIDLIYGLPGQTLLAWERNLDTAIELSVPHISAYHLTYEVGTVLYRQLQQKVINPVGESTSEEMFWMLKNKLQRSGLWQYEISNFAKPGMESKHNSAYWEDIPYIGLGPSAHSYNLVSRQWNVSDIEVYLDSMERGELSHEIEMRDIYTRYNDFIMTSLRTMKGMDIEVLKEKFGEELKFYCLKNASKYVDRGLLASDMGRIRLTDKSIFVSDGIISDLLWV